MVRTAFPPQRLSFRARLRAADQTNGLSAQRHWGCYPAPAAVDQAAGTEQLYHMNRGLFLHVQGRQFPGRPEKNVRNARSMQCPRRGK